MIGAFLPRLQMLLVQTQQEAAMRAIQQAQQSAAGAAGPQQPMPPGQPGIGAGVPHGAPFNPGY